MSTFPGLNDPLIALSLTAIEPGLNGVLIGGPPGTGKTTIARAAKTLWSPNSPFVNVPLGCTMERLVGGVDLERSYKAGKLVAAPGLLAEANGGVLYVDEINLLVPELATAILQALTTEEVQLEREGISKIYPTKFTLIGTFNPAEVPLDAAIKERIAFNLSSKTLGHLAWRVFMAARAGQTLSMPMDIVKKVQNARNIIHQITIDSQQIEALCSMASKAEIEGNRSEIFAVRCAKANAALHGRPSVTQPDIDLAMRLIFMSRLGKIAIPKSDKSETENITKSQDSPEKKTGHSEKTTPNTKGKDSPKEHSENNSQKRQSQPEGVGGDKQGRLIDDLPEITSEEIVIPNLPTVAGKAALSRKSGRHLSGLNWRRGRHVRSVPGKPSQGRLDLLATLKAAAMTPNFLKNNTNSSEFLKIQKNHYRIKQFQQRAGLLFIFAIDGSGSMAINHFRTARGAAKALLEKAYVYRDKVAVVYFRKNEAKLLLPPGNSLALASKALKSIKVGGRTPISAALVKTLALAKQAPLRWDVAGSVLIMFTDGRANQPYKTPPPDMDREVAAIKELKVISRELSDKLSAAVLFDTRRSRLSDGQGEDLADWLGAHYMYLPGADASTIGNVVEEKVQFLRG